MSTLQEQGIVEFVRELEEVGVILQIENGQLRYRAPADAVTSERLDGIRRRKADLLTYLSQEEAPGRGGAADDRPPFRVGSRPSLLPLSYGQERLWFLDQLGVGRAAYNIVASYRLAGILDAEALRRAFATVIERHEALRTRFDIVEGEGRQVIVPPGDVEIRLEDLSADPPDSREARMTAIRIAEAAHEFDLTEAPPLRIVLIRLSPRLHALSITTHHIVTDRWSFDLFLKEISAHYSAFAQDEPSPDLPAPLQYSDFTLWERAWLTGPALERRLDYWVDRVRDVPDQGALPADRVQAAPDQSPAAYHMHVLGADLSDAIRALAIAEGATPFAVMLAAYQTLLARLTGQEDVIVGGAVSGRTVPETEGIIGFFANTVPLRARIGRHASFRSLLKAVSTHAVEAQENQDVPYTKLVAALRPERRTGEQPLINSAFVFQAGSGDPFTLHGLKVEPLEIEITEAAFDLSMRVQDAGRIATSLVFAANKFEPKTIARIASHFETLLSEIVRNPGLSPMELPLMPAAERDMLLKQWNATVATEAPFRPVAALISEQAALTPRSDAVVLHDRRIDYAELEERSNRLAHYLVARGIRAESVVGVCMDRSIETILVLLAVLKSGGAYLPLDPALPRERLDLMASDAGARLIVHHARFAERLPAGVEAVAIDDEATLTAGLPATPPEIDVDPDQLATLLYTSGSTGTPKGSMLLHRGLANLVEMKARSFRPTAASRILQFARLSFDSATYEMIIALTTGASLHLLDQAAYDDAALLQKLLRDQAITMAILPPALMPLLDRDELPELELVISAGEALPAEVARTWSSGRRMLNGYGPTECTVCSTLVEFDRVGDRPPSIGRPIPNARTYVLDRKLQPVPVGVAGELFIGGAGLSRGYLNRPGLTAEKFVPDPFSRGGGRLYRTGDRVRWREDGELEFLGRLDNQIKLRGFRVELGEIEAAAARHRNVAQAVATLSGAAGAESLTLYVVAVPGDEIAAETVLEHLRGTLPSYMVPQSLVVLGRLPLTANGKLDRAALPAPERSDRGHAPPATPTEKLVAGIWQELLGLERVGRHDNFFELGGHSLLAMRMVARARDALSLELPLQKLFEKPTLADVAATLDSLGAAAPVPPLVAQERSPEGAPLSFAQERLWLLDQMKMAGAAYHIPVGLRLTGRLRIDKLEAALAALVERHESLRTRFAMVDGEARQFVMPTADFALELAPPLTDSARPEEDAAAFIATEVKRPFDLATGPLFRASLLELGRDDHLLALTMHHIVSDGWSMAVLSNELSALYRSFVEGGANPLPPLAIQYADYAIWQRSWQSPESLERQANYWRTALEGAPALLDLPTDRQRPAQQSFEGGIVDLRFDETLTAQLKSLSRAHDVTLFVTVLTGWALVMSSLSGQKDLVVGAPSANRTRSEIEGLIGFFINTLALRVDLSGNPTVADLLERVKAVALDAQANQDLPHEQVVELVRPSRSLSHSPIFQVLFSWQSNDAAQFDLPDLAVTEVSSEHTISKFDMTLNMLDAGDHLIGAIEYATGLFDRSTIERWIGYLRAALAAMAANPQRPVGSLDLLSAAERETILVEWNATQSASVAATCIHQLFEAQVEKAPDAAAVSDGDRSLSYAALNRRANRLARHLRNMGVGPDMPVAICAEPSFDMVVGVLAILKAGGAYVPLDPLYPAPRLSHILTDSQILVLLTQSHLESALPSHWGITLILDDEDPAVEHQSDDNIPPDSIALGPGHLAYVIYTSGSTGRPKGVMVEHRNVANYLAWLVEAYGPEQGETIPLSTPLAFDATVTSFWGALTTGRCLVLLPKEDERLTRLAAAMSDGGAVSLVKATPAHLHILDGFHPDVLRETTTHALVVGGEAFPAALARSWRKHAPQVRLINEYGPTETTVGCTTYELDGDLDGARTVPIGRPIRNTKIYLLNDHGTPVPIGAVGEIHIGGAGVARGYLNHPELTAQRFVACALAAGDRLYRTGDLARYRPDGNLEFLGRNDFQVKLRGFRIEVEEIESRLADHPAVREAVVMLSGDDIEDQRLVAYWTPSGADAAAEVKDLREHVAASLPSYMVPSVYVRLDAFTLTANGKLDRSALPDPDRIDFDSREHVPPVGPVEQAVASIWEDVLGVERVGRQDNFFDLGGHSLLAVRILERMQHAGLTSDVQTLFTAASLAEFAEKSAAAAGDAIEIPPNRIPEGCTKITPDLLPLIDLDQGEIDRVAATVPGGAANIRDVYPLAPLQGGILFHTLLARAGDPYIVWHHLDFRDRPTLDRFVAALNATIERHDILRTSLVWDGLREPVQVVWRRAPLVLEEPAIDPAGGAILADLHDHFDPRRHGMDLNRAPLIRIGAAFDPEQDRWVAMLMIHHLIDDNLTLKLFMGEVGAHMAGEQASLQPSLPFRDFIARNAIAAGDDSHRPFFDEMLGSVTETTHAFGLADVAGDGGDVEEVRVPIDGPLDKRLRRKAIELGVSNASIFHVVWASILAEASGRTDPVFGTMVSGRLRGTVGIHNTLGLFINTLPIRIDLAAGPAGDVIKAAHARIAQLLRFENVPLNRVIRSSGIRDGSPLFTALFNYRQSSDINAQTDESPGWEGIRHLAGLEVSNYPLYLMVDDVGDCFWLSVQATRPLDAKQLAERLKAAVEEMLAALEDSASAVLTPRAGPPAGIVPPARPAGNPMPSVPAGDRARAEALLASLWAELLGADEIGADDKFFALGGTSLLLIRLSWLLQSRGWPVRLRDLFEAPDFAAMAGCVAGVASTPRPTSPRTSAA
ncbi:MAG TPA: amino acid adenylation domain-containing protein [Allosphingosinicella sp.]